MPLVFVHGVNNRADQEYYENERIRSELFRLSSLDGVVTKPAEATILNPYWGKFGAKFYWNTASIPDGDYESFGSTDDAFDEVIVATGAESDAPLISLANESLARAVDAAWAAAARSDELDEGQSKKLAALGWRAANYAAQNPQPAWLGSVGTDMQFLEELLDAVDKWEPAAAPADANEPKYESFGSGEFLNHLKTGAVHLGQAAGRLVGRVGVDKVRPWAFRRFGLFLGDVFEYTEHRGEKGNEGPIVAEVANAFAQADAQRKQGVDDKLIIVGHSMGGNIAYDILTYFRPDIKVDVFLTVASQVGVFEELKMFKGSEKSISGPPGTVPKPPNVKHWLNVFDRVDVLAYATERIFSDTKDYDFTTGKTPLSAHSMYLYCPSFHQRFRARLLESLK